MSFEILSGIKCPSDVKKFNSVELQELCSEIRECIIDTVSKNGGHLASNLGAVELTVALHRVFNSPTDSIIFDVGHQSYTHKLLTGRFSQFSTLRTEGGISGFMKPGESEHDPFITGHSSNSISAAYGIYKAKKLSNQNGSAIAVIGDGALTGGMAYEALNNVAAGKSNFIVVLNDNKMSISRNVGALSRSLTKMRNKPKYHYFKLAFSKFLLKIPFIGEKLNSFAFSLKESFKNLIYKNNFFSSLGLNYLGPVDGHNIEAMESLFKIAQSYNRPTLVHVITTKGKGYSYAEHSPKNYHGVSPFDIDEGASSGGLNFSEVAGNTLCEMAQRDDKICAVTAAMTAGTGLSEFEKRFKNRFFDVGIAEQHAVTFCAGLAKGGMKPYFAVYSSFLQRAVDQIIHDCAIEGLPVRLLVDRAGVVGEDGETHQGVFDISLLSSVPGIEIYSPCNYQELELQLKNSTNASCVTAIRYPRGTESSFEQNFDFEKEFIKVGNNEKVCIVTYGRLFSVALDAQKDADFDIIKLNKVYPFGNDLINLLQKYERIYVYEETVKNGGIGEHLSSLLAENEYNGNFEIHAIDNKFVPASSVSATLKSNQLDCESMIRSIKCQN